MNDRRVELFCSEQMPEVFHPIAHLNDVFRPDPYDVREVHLEAREHFERLVEAASTDAPGRILLIKGESGSGKTHLMRAFRNHVHEFNLGFFAYLQMTTQAPRYDRYILQKVIESLDRPYCPPTRESSSLKILSDALARLLPSAKVELLRHAEDGQSAGPLVDELTDGLVDRLCLPDVSPDMLRVLLYLQLDRPNIQQKVRKYLRLEALSDHERAVLGGIAPRNLEDDAIEVVEQLIRVVRRVLERSFVICIDQLEDMANQADSADRFGRAMDAVKQLGAIPGTVVVVACHQVFYAVLRGKISDAVLARVEQAPGPIELRTQRLEGEAAAILGHRLRHLFQSNGAEWDEARPVEPIPREVIAKLELDSTRALLADAGRYRDHARHTKALAAAWPVNGAPKNGHAAAPADDLLRVTQEWNDCTAEAHAVPEGEAARLALLGRAIAACGAELGAPSAFGVVASDGEDFRVEHRGVNGAKDLVVGLCDRSARGNGLANQIRTLEQRAKGARPVIVRSTEFPKTPNTQVGKLIGQIVAKGGRRAIVEDTEWRSMVALEAFRGRHAGPVFDAFLRQEKPLSSLAGLRLILDLDELELTPPAPPPSPEEPKPTPADRDRSPSTHTDGVRPDPSAKEKSTPPAAESPTNGQIVVGRLISRTPRDIALRPEQLKRHATFLGGTGSGKTTAALMIIESLLARGIPALLVDRKGDLAGYRRPGVWAADTGDAERDAFRRGLLAKVDVALYTPGHPGGRGLALSILPAGLSERPTFEQEQAARVSALALAEMMAYGAGQKAQGKKAALQVALQYLAREPKPPSLGDLVALVKDRDPSIVGELGALAKFLDDLGVDLEILERQKRTLLESGTERLDAAALFGRDPGAPKDRTRLGILSTKFLQNRQDELFWVAQLLMEIYRWINKAPSNDLQAVLLLDEADTYLPAVRQPATKQPVEDLLRRARSMGLGVFLATQNPGDFDYRCRDNILTWFVGRLGAQRGIEKVEEMFGEAQASTADLAGQATGQFHILSERLVSRAEVRRNAVVLPTQLSDDEILRLAAAGTARAEDLARQG